MLGRRRPRTRGAWPAHARAGNLALAHLLRRRTGLALRDLGPMRAARRTDLLDLGLSHGQTVLVIYALCVALALLSFLLSGTGQLYAFMGLALAFGLALFLFTRDETGDALEAETYEAEHPDPPAESA